MAQDWLAAKDRRAIMLRASGVPFQGARTYGLSKNDLTSSYSFRRGWTAATYWAVNT